jgi:[ribosomal protein S5]-alanine N-acetyltransferase
MVDWKFEEEAKKVDGTDWSQIPFPPKPIVQSNRLLIRPLHINDAPQIAKCINDPEILKRLTNRLPNPYKVSDAECFINNVYKPAKSVATHFGIIPISEGSSQDDLPVGVISVEPGPDVHIRAAEMGYWMASSEMGKGYMTEAANMIIDWSFKLLNGLSGEPLMRISLNIFGGNEASIAVGRKAGFKAEGVLRDCVWKNGELLDLVIYGMTRTDWKERRREP